MGKKKFKRKPGASLDERKKMLKDASRQLAQETKQNIQKGGKYTVGQLLEKAEECIDKFDHEIAQKFCQRALEMEPDNIRALETSGSLLLEIGNPEGAKQCFGRAVELSPEEGHSKYMYLGQLFEGVQAVECFQKGIELMVKEKAEKEAKEVAAACGGDRSHTVTDQDISNAYLSIAEIYMTDCCFEADAEERCKESIEKAIEVDKQNAEALRLKASFLLLKEKKEEAKETMKESVMLWLPQLRTIAGAEGGADTSEIPLSYDSRVSAVKVLIEVEDYELAVEVLEFLLDENEDDIELWYLLGWSNYLQGEDFRGNARYYFNKARKIFAKTKQADPDQMEHIKELLEELGPGDDMDSDAEDQGTADNEDLEKEIISDDESMEH